MIEKSKQERSIKDGKIAQSSPARPTIAFLAGALDNHFSLAMWTSIVEAAQERNVNVINIEGKIEDLPEGASLSNPIFLAVNEDIIDAIIIYGSRLCTYIPEEKFQKFCDQLTSKPIVSIGQQAEGIPSVLTDNYNGMHDLVRHFIDQHGYRRIAFIQGPENQNEAKERFRAYQNALTESDIQLDPDLISPPGSWEAFSGENAIRLFVDERQVDFEAIIGANDALALDAMWALKKRDLNIPDDVAVGGFDGQIIAAAADPPLSTVRQLLKEQCRYSVDTILSMLNGDKVLDLTVMPTKLCIRQSCGCTSFDPEEAIARTFSENDTTDQLNPTREDVKTKIARIVNPTIKGLEINWSTRLFDTFIADIESDNSNKFLQELTLCIEETLPIDIKINEWQKVISMLRHFASAQYNDQVTGKRINDLSDQARVLIIEKVNQIETHLSLIFDQQYAALREITRTLSIAHNLEDILEILYQSLPRFGIRSCYLFLYKKTLSDNKDESHVDLGQLKMIFAFDEKGRVPLDSKASFLTSNLLFHRDNPSRNDSKSFMVKTLKHGDEPIGIILFEVYPPDGKTCDMLEEQISISLANTLLLQEQQQEQQMLQQAYTEVETHAKEKEIELEFEIVDRKQAQQALIREQQLLHMLMDNSLDYIYFKDRENRFIQANRTLAERYGKETPEDLNGLTDFDLFAEEHARTAFNAELHLLETGEPIIGIEEREIWPDGRVTWVSTSKLPLRDEEGNIIGTFGISRDITASKQAEQELQQHAAHLEALNKIISSTSIAADYQELLKITLDHCLYALDLDMGLIWMTPHIVSHKLLPPENEFPHYDFDPESCDLPEILAIEDWQEVPEGDPRYPFYQTFLKPHGVRASIIVPIRVEEDNYLGGICSASREPFSWTMEDVKLLKAVGFQIGIAAMRLQLIDRLLEQMQQVQYITDTVPDGVLLLDSDNRVMLANPAGKRDLEILTKTSVGDAITQLGSRPIDDILQVETNIPFSEVKANNRIFEVVSRPILAHGETTNWVVVIRDVTQERETQRQVQQQERLAAVGQLAGGIAHDFNNLLTTIMLYAQMPLRKYQLPEKIKKPLETILGEARKAADLIQQILDFSRHAPIDRYSIDLGPFIKEAVRVLQRTIPETISLYFEIQPDEYFVEADPTRIQQVLMNLVVNARDAMPEGGSLRVGISSVEVFEATNDAPVPEMTPGRWFCLSVKDTGTGIPEDILEHIFEPFFTTKPVGKGTGLGLSQVWGIVKQHEGFIKVDTAIGEGTEFLVYLPMHKAVETSESAPEPDDDQSVPKGTGERILLVEDSQHVRNMSEALLIDLGYQVVTSKNGREALEIIKQNGNFDVIFTDIVMPEVGGLDLINALHEMGCEAKTIAASGHLFPKEVQELRDKGVSGILFKPLEAKEVADELRRILDAK